MKTQLPYVTEIPYLDSVELFDKFHHQPWALFLDSATHPQGILGTTNRYSYILFSPFKTFQVKNKNILDPFKLLKQEFLQYKLPALKNLPPFQGGLAGYFGYDLCHYLEDIPYPQIDDMDFPDLAVGLYDCLISFDHQLKKSWIVSTGFPELNLNQQNIRALERTCEILKILSEPIETNSTTHDASACFNTPASNFTQESYIEAIEAAKNYIREGDIFEVNLSQRFKTKLPDHLDTYTLYKNLRRFNPAPFATFMRFEDTVLASASPERFISLNSNIVETRPIKGTIRRGLTPSEDKSLMDFLKNSKKDHAENVMIVDLMRNDLSLVCEPDSVNVETLCGLETYATVHHLVSVIKAQLKEQYHALDLLYATLPGGSITGAPKIRAMEIIAELEPNRRGPYCGSAGFISFSGDMDTSILIRTYAIKNNTVTYQAGGAVVLDSDAQTEYEETLHKAYALTQTLRQST
jgi:para-aminobenzoate synthetase component 1